MARMMKIDGEMWRAVILKKRMVRNPAYDPYKSWQQTDASGNRIPSSIPSETETFTEVYGPYERKTDAQRARTRESRNAYDSQHVVGAHLEHAIITWEVLDD